MTAAIAFRAGGTNVLHHDRDFGAIDEQTVIRQNRDTFYTVVVADISEGATLTLPEPNGRYMSAMAINRDHYINEVLHEAGDHALTMDRYDTDYVVVGVRILVDPNDPDDLEAVHQLQDQIRLDAGAARPFEMPDYDEASFDATRAALLELAKGTPNFGNAFGVGEYSITVGDVPVDSFWSVSLYNAAGFFEPNDRGAYSVNSITAEPNSDGTVTVNFGGCGDERPNCLPIMDGWNYLVRFYQPHPEVIDGTWTFPTIAT